MILTLYGHIPSKKNAYAQRRDGRRFRDRETVRQIHNIVRQILEQCGNLEPFDHPSIKAHFICKDGRADLDNKYTCLQDCLVSAGLFKADNLAHLHGPITFSGEINRKEEERVIIEIL